MGARHDFTSGQGATFSTVVTWEIGPDADSLVPVNVTGYTARMQLRKKATSPDPVVSLTDGAGLVLGGAAGTIGITIAAAASSAIAAGKYLYDLELESAGGVVSRVLEGTITFTPEITK